MEMDTGYRASRCRRHHGAAYCPHSFSLFAWACSCSSFGVRIISFKTVRYNALWSSRLPILSYLGVFCKYPPLHYNDLQCKMVLLCNKMRNKLKRKQNFIYNFALEIVEWDRLVPIYLEYCYWFIFYLVSFKLRNFVKALLQPIKMSWFLFKR